MESLRYKIEELSNKLEKTGFTPVSSRVFIYMMLIPEGETTFEDLILYFGVSKSAVSNALKSLIAMDIVTERTKSGKRKRFFSISFTKLVSINTILDQYSRTKEILEEIKTLRKSNDEIDAQILSLLKFVQVMEQELPRLFEKNFPEVKS